MALHLLKLCVGADSVADLEGWVAERVRERVAKRQKPRSLHVTRMVPTRPAEIVEGGSLYWVIRGQIAARQQVLDIEPFLDADGVGRCRLWLDREVVKSPRAPIAPSRAGVISRARTHPPISARAARRRCRRSCGARLANSDCYSARPLRQARTGVSQISACGSGWPAASV